MPEESTSEIVEEAVHAKQKEVERRQELQEKLQSICRSRLETLEEETVEEKEELKVVEVEKEAADTETQSDIKGTSKEKTPNPDPKLDYSLHKRGACSYPRLKKDLRHL